MIAHEFEAKMMLERARTLEGLTVKLLALDHGAVWCIVV
jgi:hypothetical protein